MVEALPELDADWTRKATGSWVVFWVVFLALAAFDLACLAPRSAKDADAVSAGVALCHALFWFVIGLGFNVAIWFALGQELAIAWFDGYLLEYLLSMDNVFFFHVVFKSYSTPSTQTYKGLFLGIIGAVVLRLAFYFIGSGVFRLAFAAKVFFGVVLVYSGYKTATTDEEDEDPRENRCVQCMTRVLPLTDSYDDGGALIVRVRERGEDAVKPEVIGAQGSSSTSASGHDGRGEDRGRLRGTMLLLVVLVLQVVDVLFAVDSVTAKIAEYDHIFINFSSSAFAMLCLRSLYFVLTRLLKYFRFLKFGVSLILVLIGVKLVATGWWEVSAMFSLGVISAVFAVSIIASALFPEPDADELDEVQYDDAKQDLEEIGCLTVSKASANDSPRDSSNGRGLDLELEGEAVAYPAHPAGSPFVSDDDQYSPKPLRQVDVDTSGFDDPLG